MKVTPIVTALISCALLSACAAVVPNDDRKIRVSNEYEVAGDSKGIRAFVYGKRTVLQIDGSPFRVVVHDENGVPVNFERYGNYYRLPRRLNNFSLWVNLKALSFYSIEPESIGHPNSALPTPAITTDSSHPTGIQVESAAPTTTPTDPTVATAENLLKLSAEQLEEVRAVIKASTLNQNDLDQLRKRLDRIESQIFSAATVMVQIHFDTASTELRADSNITRTLIPAALAADRINVRGRTDSRIAGKKDHQIALGRALAARRFLVDHGVESKKISVFSLPAGDFIATPNTPAGKALNRRVEIELVNQRFADLRRQQMALAAQDL